MGASSRSPSPMTIMPSICSESMVLRIASTATSSALWRSPKPMVRAAAMAAFSTTRRNSRLSCASISFSVRNHQAGSAEHRKPSYAHASRVQRKVARFLLFPREFGRRGWLRAVVILECGLHPCGGAWHVFWMIVQMHEHGADVEGGAAKFAEGRRKRRTAGTSRRRNRGRQLHCVHAPGGQGFVRILQEPCAVVPVENKVCGEKDPLARIFPRRILAIPVMRVGNRNCGV